MYDKRIKFFTFRIPDIIRRTANGYRTTIQYGIIEIISNFYFLNNNIPTNTLWAIAQDFDLGTKLVDNSRRNPSCALSIYDFSFIDASTRL